ncbi:MAG TPA: D-2-hydroxyacid dehydrogenase [Burkholderiaceae bacterium]|nr:D-2-hydroxyacid dehydrogenase [Burkholderiaceae bacterium]
MPLRLVELQPDGSLLLDGHEVGLRETAVHLCWISLDIFEQHLAARIESLLHEAAGLRWLHTVHAGLDWPIYAALLARGVRVSRSHAQAPAIAEFVLAHVMAVFQRHERIHASQREHRWLPHPFRELASSRWLVVGAGHAGLEIARRARALGATVVGVARGEIGDPAIGHAIKPDHLPFELPSADVVVLSCPLTDATRDLVDRTFLAAMKDSAILVNIARGGLVDEAALLEALDGGRLAHAILDVTRIEPLPPDSPLWAHERVRLTAHSAYAGSGTAARNDELFAENLRRYLAREPLLYEVSGIAAA